MVIKRSVGMLMLTFMAFAIVMMASAPSQAQAATKVCPNVHKPMKALSLAQYRRAFYCLVNAERTEVMGLYAYTTDSRVEQAAQWHSLDQKRRNFYGHKSPPPAPYGEFHDDRLSKAGWAREILDPAAAGWNNQYYSDDENHTYSLVASSEALAMNAGHLSPYETLNSWFSSPGHCTAFTNPDADMVGIGVFAGYATWNYLTDWHAFQTGKYFAEQRPKCPRKTQTNAIVKPAYPRFTAKVKRRGTQLRLRLKTNMGQLYPAKNWRQVRISIWQNGKKPGTFKKIKVVTRRLSPKGVGNFRLRTKFSRKWKRSGFVNITFRVCPAELADYCPGAIDFYR